MYLAQLDLHGFKSFANKTSVRFDTGITAIVGPNGCGKSNIVDALRWVLGEQRASLLRSSAMQNVIFNGTATKKALGMAEVSVKVENNLGILPLEFSEVVITRRLYRSGESEYLLNGSVCRLKDIVELFMDTGMGPGAYSVIELKMVEEILNDKNNDRLRLFEEAAGVTKYKEKRKHTLRKLDETKTDMLRVEDILVEIRKKVRSLQLQAKKAERAKEYSDQLYVLDLGWNRFEYDRILDELKPLRESLIRSEKEKSELIHEFASLEEEERLAREELDLRETNLQTTQKAVNALFSQIRDSETSITLNNQKIESEKNVILNFESDIRQAELDITDLKRRKEISSKLVQERSNLLTTASEEADKYQELVKGVELEVTELRRKIANFVKEQEQVNRELTELRTSRVRLESRFENTAEDLARISNQKQELDEQLFIASKDIEMLDAQLVKLNSGKENFALELRELKEARTNLSATINELKDNLRTLMSKSDALIAERELLRQIAQSQESFPSGVQHLLKLKEKFPLMDVVTDIFSTNSTLAAALEASLGEVCNMIVVESVNDAIALFEQLITDDKGRIGIIPLELVQQLNTTLYPESIAHQVSCDSKFTQLRNLLLGNVILSDSLNDATEALKNNAFLYVTHKGDVISPSGVIKSGSTQKNLGIRVGLKSRMESLSKAIENNDESILRCKEDLSEKENKLKSLNEAKAEEQLKQAELSIRKAENQKNTISSQKVLFEKNLQSLTEREHQINAQTASSKEQIKELEPRIEHLNARLEGIVEEQLHLRNELRDKESHFQRIQQSLNEAKLTYQRLVAESEGYKREVAQAEQGISTIKQRLEQRAEQAKNSRTRISELQHETELFTEHLEKLRLDKKQADSLFEEAQEKASRQRGRIRSLEEQIKQMHRKREINSELLHQLEIRQSRLEMQSKTLLDYVWETYGKMIEQIEERLDEEIDPNTVKTTISNLKERLKSIGEVNHLAITEYEEEQKRLDFYEQQINDLYEAEEKLRETISEINKTANERFSTTFDAIRTNFKRVFNMLFREDDFCDLVLREKSDDPLDNKVEIIAKPRGKRPSNIEQLSGGEKTLTAIALLFAIYLVKPSPFCILDEVDAPLDDANVDRFTGLIRQFSTETQFIVITHNKKTMEKAEVMYGVTMQETGVSKLVGVRVDEAVTT